MSSEKAPTRSDDPWRCFAYLTAEKSPLYRAIIERFATAKSEFVLHLRPTEVHSQVQLGGDDVELSEVEAALDQLEEWGNLQSYKDNTDVSSLKDFYRKKLLFQLTASGEAAHAAALAFKKRLGEQARLDARALERIADTAAQLCRLASDDRLDGPLVLTTLRNICQDADDLTDRAQSFFRWLHEQTESERTELAAFLHYKEELIEYLQHFIGELIARGGEIATRLVTVEMESYERLALVAAGEDVGEPRAGDEQDHSIALENSRRGWLGRLMGLHGWFVGRDSRPPQSEQLRAAARAAIPRLLMVASQINERRSGRSNRQADLRQLAIWFAEAHDDAAAHRLFRAAFACSPARHMRVDQRTLEVREQLGVRPEASWLEAPPVEVAPQLRKTGRQPIGSANRRIVDRSPERAAARRRLSLESSRDQSSHETLIALGRVRLSDIGEIDGDTFRLLMELLELAAPKPDGDATARATNRDGSLRIKVEPAAEQASVATVATVAGTLYAQDVWLEVSRAT